MCSVPSDDLEKLPLVVTQCVSVYAGNSASFSNILTLIVYMFGQIAVMKMPQHIVNVYHVG